MVFLCDLTPGATGRVAALRTRGPMRRRLMELGLVEGTTVACLQKAPWGDPAAYRIRGAVIALRKIDAMGVLVKGDGPWE